MAKILQVNEHASPLNLDKNVNKIGPRGNRKLKVCITVSRNIYLPVRTLYQVITPMTELVYTKN